MRFLAPILAVALALGLWPLHGALLDWDEVGYVHSGRLGFIANYFEIGTLGYGDFREFVTAKREKRPPNLPADHDEDSSPIMARHVHPPLVAYLLSAVGASNNERVLRSVQLFGAIALALAMIFAHGVLSRERTWLGSLVIALASLWIGIFLFAEISFHGWTAVFVATSAALTVRYLDEPSKKNLRWLGASIAFSALALQTGAFVFIAVALCLLARKHFKDTLRLGLVTGIVFLVFWPGAILTSAFIRIPAHYAYAIARGEEYASVGTKESGVWQAISPMLFLVPLALAVLWRYSRGELKRVVPMLVVGVLYTLALTKFAIAPRYLLPGMAALAPIVALAADVLPRKIAFRVPAVLALLASFILTLSVRPSAEHDGPLRHDLAWLRENLGSRPAFMQGGHIYRHYLEESQPIRSIRVDRNALLIRESGHYRPLVAKDLEGALIAVKKKRERSSSAKIPEALLAPCKKTELEQVLVYECEKAPGSGS